MYTLKERRKKGFFYQIFLNINNCYIYLTYKIKIEQDFREKNVDQVRPDIVGVLKSSNLSFLRELMGETD